MRIEQNVFLGSGHWEGTPPGVLGGGADLVFVFGSRGALESSASMEVLRDAFPNAQRIGCSTSGEIAGTRVHDDSIVVTAVDFEHTWTRAAEVSMNEVQNSFEAGKRLAKMLDPRDLTHVLVLSDGLGVNGSDLVAGLTNHLPKDVAVTGGLAGDGDRFERTLVFGNGSPRTGVVAAIGMYGDRLKVSFGSLGGWDPFGPERVITRSSGNVLHELDGKSALGLYQSYLGEHAKGLPATGLLYPLALRVTEGQAPVVRTILSVDHHAKSLTFAGDVPEGAYARLMKANFDRLIDGATGAARASCEPLAGATPELALLISCVGRKLLLQQRIEEEVEGVRDVLGKKACLMGFYSYGEIAPFSRSLRCELHNQTMTITTFSEN